MVRRILLTAAVVLGSVTIAPATRVAEACPMCKLANEEGSGACPEEAALKSARPRAYMYSILFMLTMPATIFSGFSFAFYRLHRRQQAISQADGFDPFTA